MLLHPMKEVQSRSVFTLACQALREKSNKGFPSLGRDVAGYCQKLLVNILLSSEKKNCLELIVGIILPGNWQTSPKEISLLISKNIRKNS